MPTITIDLPETLLARFEAYCKVWDRSLPEVIEMLLQHATITQFPVIWLERVNPELYATQLAVEDEQRLERLLTT